MTIDATTIRGARQSRSNEETNEPGSFRRKGDFLRGPYVVGVLLLTLIGVFRYLGISLRFQGLTFFGLYLSIAIQSTAYTMVLIALQYPSELFVPGLRRIINRPELILAGLALGFLFFRLLPIGFAIPALVAVLFLFAIPLHKISKVLVPGLYLFVGLLTAFGFNVAVVTVRFEPNYDQVLQKVDQVLLFGHSVSELSHQFAASVPHFVPGALLVWYALMFPQIGAALMLCSTFISREYAMRFVSAILVAYALSVAIFFAFPTHSPYFSCVGHISAGFPAAMVQIQEQFVRTATARFHGLRAPLGPEYYISFPCMHIAQPLIAMWFLRRWRRMLIFLGIVNLILIFAIVILEWHYFADIIGGIVLAAISVWLVDVRIRRPGLTAVA